ncbi:hypothetical protein TrispH2_008807 [Trichoplax sp. H2]|nr:hypothetical protein TrispH2_008807 [Trichoplax sp. H2]|eukprot:RDD39943.1 hypothetical protein TrispH2_008807 [Trichoplax sp. H2]
MATRPIPFLTKVQRGVTFSLILLTVYSGYILSRASYDVLERRRANKVLSKVDVRLKSNEPLMAHKNYMYNFDKSTVVCRVRGLSHGECVNLSSY